MTNESGHIDSKLYDKRDNFPFSIVRLLYASSNVPSRMFYNCIGAEILGIGMVCSNVTNFIRAGKVVIDRGIKQGAKVERLEKVLKKIYGRHHVLRSFKSNAKEFSDCLLND